MPKTNMMLLRHLPFFLSVACLTLCPALQTHAAPATPPPAKPKPAPAAPATPIDGFDTASNPDNFSVTPAQMPSNAHVEGAPTNMTQHPNIFCDQADVDHWKEMLKTSKELQMQFTVLKAKVDKRIDQPIEVPVPQKAADGTYPFIGEGLPDFPSKYAGGPPYTDPFAKFRNWFTTDSDMVSDCGFLYAITGDKKYAEYAKKLLMAWARTPEWGPMKNVNLRSGQGVWGQIFEEGLIMDHYVRGYDFIYDLPGWTAEERKKIHDDFFWPMALVWAYPAAPDFDKDNAGGAFLSQVNNRGLITLTGVLAMGEITGDQQMIDVALYGIHTDLKKNDPVQSHAFPPLQSWTVATKDNPGHGLLNTYFGPGLIPGGCYSEGTPSYANYALGSMIDCAEICWRHGIDLYSNNNFAFKNMFDFQMLISYPDLTTPALNDAHRETLLGGAAPAFFEYAYRRYKDPRYFTLINTPEEREYLKLISDPAVAAKMLDEQLNPPPPPPKPEPGAPPAPPAPEEPKSSRHITFTQIGSMPPSIMYDVDPNLGGTTLPVPPSVNFKEVGFGIIRSPSTSGGQVQQVILSSGPSASHGHPDKLAIDVYAMNNTLIPSPGVNFPYTNPNIPKWLHTTLAHNVLTVDEELQVCGERTSARADESVYGTCSTGGLERAWSCSAYPGVTMDRAIFMRPNYMADIYSAFSTAPHKYDLAWHIFGKLTSDQDLSQEAPINKAANGYNFFTSAKAAAATDKAWSVTTDRDGNTAHLLVAGGASTLPIVGEGGITIDHTAHAPGNRPLVPTLIERREGQPSTIYGNVLDFSNGKTPYVKSIAQEGDLDKGYALLSVTTTDGTDLCFAAYRPGSYTAGGLTTDALQAYAGMKGSIAETLYLGGGTKLSAGGGSITRSTPGLAYVEKALDGTYIIGNPSASPTTVSVTLPALSGLDAFTLDVDDKKGAAATGVTVAGTTVTAQLPAQGKIGFYKK